MIEIGSLSVHYVNTNDNLADIFTKALSIQTFQRLRDAVGITAKGSNRRGQHKSSLEWTSVMPFPQ